MAAPINYRLSVVRGWLPGTGCRADRKCHRRGVEAAVEANRLRPWPVVTVLRDAAIAGQLPSLLADFWLLPAAPSRLS